MLTEDVGKALWENDCRLIVCVTAENRGRPIQKPLFHQIISAKGAQRQNNSRSQTPPEAKSA